MKTIVRFVLFTALLVCSLGMRAQKSAPDVRVDRGENYELIKILDGYYWPYDISNNKEHVIIQSLSAENGYYWSEATGSVSISGSVYAVSENGSVAGFYSNSNSSKKNVAGLWSPETQSWEFLGMNPDVPEFSTDKDFLEYNGALSMTDDGSKVGIIQYFGWNEIETYIWTKEGGYEKLDNGVSPQTKPYAISDDGRVIAGYAAHENTNERIPCYWIDGKINRIPHLFGEALNVSHNGNYICGQLDNGHAFIFDIKNQKLVEATDSLNPNNQLFANCVSNNGTIFGYSGSGTNSPKSAFAYVGGELMTFNSYLELNGVLDASGWNIYNINNITEDDKTFIGVGNIDGKECSFVLTINNICDAPRNLTYAISEENHNDLILSWDAPENAENVTYNIYTNYSETAVESDITETTFTLSDLEPGEYQYMVRANYNNECLSEISNVVYPTIYPCAENDKCELEIIKYDNYGDGWSNASISIVGSNSEIVYTAKLSEGGGIFESTNPDYLNGDTTVLYLCPDTYQFTWNEGLWDNECAFVIVFQGEELYRKNYEEIDENFKENPMFFEYELNCEKEDDFVCGAPSNLTYVINEDRSSVTLSWIAPENPIDVTYEIYYNDTVVEPTYSEIIDTSFTINNLEPGNHSFLVKANWRGECLSDPSNTVNITIPTITEDDEDNNEDDGNDDGNDDEDNNEDDGNDDGNDDEEITEGSEIIKITDDHHCPYDISNNKKHVVIQAYAEYSSYYWSEETGVIPFDGYGFAVSDEGVVAGYYTNEEGYNVAGLWYPETQQWEFLGMNSDVPEFIPDNLEYNQAWAMSNDGKAIGVMQFDEFWNTETYVWSERKGYVKLANGGSNVTRPNGMNNDGSVVVGIFTDEIGYRAPCYWVDGEIYQISSYAGEAMNVSPNGRFVCGSLKDSKSSAFVYDITNEELIMIENTLTDFPGSMTAMCVTDNGDAFGYINTGHPADYNLRRGFAYTEGELMLFEEYLIINGVQEAESWKVYSVNSVTPDGKTFLGAAEMKDKNHTFVLTVNDEKCGAPTNLRYTTNDNDHSTITLRWNAPENPVNVTYEIYDSYTSIDPLFYGLTEDSIIIDNLAPGHYRFLVKANWGGECLSYPTNAVDVTIFPCNNKEMCELTFNMLDGYGDGWNGAFVEIRSSNSDFSYKVGLEKEGLDTVTKTLSLCPDNYIFVWNRGDFDEELSFTIIYNEEEIYRLDAGDIDALFETVFLEYEIDCGNNNDDNNNDDNNNDDNIDDTESLEDVELDNTIIICPNPVGNELFLATELRVEEVSIYDIYGRQTKVYGLQSTDFVHSLDVADLHSGVYFVKIKTNDGNIVKRFIKN